MENQNKRKEGTNVEIRARPVLKLCYLERKRHYERMAVLYDALQRESSISKTTLHLAETLLEEATASYHEISAEWHDRM